jgi:hypothetical protein
MSAFGFKQTCGVVSRNVCFTAESGHLRGEFSAVIFEGL